MSLFQVVYASRPFGYDQGILNGILADARRCNERDGITGSLVCRDDLYLQLLEGPADLVTATFERIAKDDRHLEVRRLLAGPAATRIFPDWAMRHDPARSWMWTPDEVTDGAPERAGRAEVLGVFQRIAAEAGL
ncbi:MAG: BLUF domain-containing protein [Brevundimonas sp.]|uniref:BLUF domain-containing protein n=1 Tax=Brevundimonas sp. TaxID=1871086 RepID=UPI002735F9E8|nr:BLUF domain-containing protein [Brevundimonas sp.]MBX9617320.1 BLUF domain-containing protein [Caulobacteraceae bacterium]MDP3405294.1 BLUF domain-containing protein [Brevundimonas sp.]